MAGKTEGYRSVGTAMMRPLRRQLRNLAIKGARKTFMHKPPDASEPGGYHTEKTQSIPTGMIPPTPHVKLGGARQHANTPPANTAPPHQAASNTEYTSPWGQNASDAAYIDHKAVASAMAADASSVQDATPKDASR